jgi:acylphosphatase
VSEQVRRRVVVRGHVQGVFFRESFRRLAERSGVAGSVENRRDGAVEAILEGEAEAVERIVDFCRTGPRGAFVEDVWVAAEEPEGVSGFAVR